MDSEPHKPEIYSNFVKELWVFWYGNEDCLKKDHLISPDLEITSSGTWKQGLSYNTRCILFKALHNLIERYLLAKGYVRLFKSFLQPCNSQSIRDKCQYSISFSFFLHGESTVCASLDIRRFHKFKSLTPKILSFCEKFSGRINVVLAPHGISARLVASSQTSDTSSERELEMWKRFFPIRLVGDNFNSSGSHQNSFYMDFLTPNKSSPIQQPQQGSKPDSSSKRPIPEPLPQFVNVLVGGFRMRYPTCFVLIAEDQLSSMTVQHTRDLADRRPNAFPKNKHSVLDSYGFPYPKFPLKRLPSSKRRCYISARFLQRALRSERSFMPDFDSLYAKFRLLSQVTGDDSVFTSESKSTIALYSTDDLPITGFEKDEDALIQMAIKNLGESVEVIRQYAELVPGFSSLTEADREKIILLHSADLITFRMAFRTAKAAAERAQLNLFHPNSTQSSPYFRPPIPTDTPRIPQQSNISAPQQTGPPFPGGIVEWHSQTNPSDPAFRPFHHNPLIGPSQLPSHPTPWQTGGVPRPLDFEVEDEGDANLAAWEVALSTPTEPGYIFENGSVMTDEELNRAGLGPWIRALTWFGWQLLELAMGDHSTVAGLSALVLINYQALCGRTDLENSSEIYTVHHRFVEMLKSHCCSPTNAVTIPTEYSGCYGPDRDPTGAVATATNAGNMLPPGRADSTYFSQVFKKKDTAHWIASHLLLQPLQRLHASGRLPSGPESSWLNTLVNLLNTGCNQSQTPPPCN
ncbi:unnamed protein product [Rodentolepis nana]|uniref:Mediator of RNA polymerase II transcription subunit 13 n=1 Tax=Rodentolepis nana TaxID=102285 RepID=A0A0R3TWY2_RODNA|nr:unnamed protein product [Rodentolepis nana]